MTAPELMAICEARGIRLQALPGDRLDIDAPADSLTPDLVEALRGCKAELLALVAGGSGGDPDHGERPTDDPEGDGRTCPACGSARIAPGRRRLWCLDCETDIGAADDPQDLPEADAADWLEVIGSDGRRIWQRADVAGCESIDWPTPCEVCGGVLYWWDLRGGQWCERCKPRTTGPRLRELAQRLLERYGLPGGRIGPAPFFCMTDRDGSDHGQHLVEQRHGRTWPPVIPESILADPRPNCSDCGRPVIPGQPGRTMKLCFGCWQVRFTNTKNESSD